MERTRHMVDISDYAWEKLERLAHRLDNAQYVYKGRPRYGKLIELAIEKLEDSTMEWTVEEVWVDGKGSDVTDELKDVLEDATIEWDSKKVWWKGDKLDKYKPEKQWWEMNKKELDEYKLANNASYGVSQGGPVYFSSDSVSPGTQAPPSMDMDLYGNAYVNADTGFPIKASSVSIKISADDTGAKQLEKLSETLKGFSKGIGASTKSAIDLAEKLDLANPYVTYGVKHPDYIEIHATLSQALSAPEQLILRKFAEAEFAKYSNDTEAYAVNASIAYAVNASIKNVPWNKLFIFASYTDPSKLTESLSDVAFFVRNRIQEWLLKGNFIGPLPKAVDITEKKLSYSKVKISLFENTYPLITLSCDLVHAMSINQQKELRDYMRATATQHASSLIFASPICELYNIPWNKLTIDVLFGNGTTLNADIHSIANSLRLALEEWLSNKLIGVVPT